MNVMVCVTQQKSCERLILEGQRKLEIGKSELYIIHVASKKNRFLNSDVEVEALDYLYDKAQEIGANLTVIRANNVLETLLNLVHKNRIKHIIMGTSGKVEKEVGLVEAFQQRVDSIAEITFVPPEEVKEEVS